MIDVSPKLEKVVRGKRLVGEMYDARFYLERVIAPNPITIKTGKEHSMLSRPELSYNVEHALFDARSLRELAADLLEAADALDGATT